MPRSYATSYGHASAQPDGWLSPRRRRNAELLAEYLRWRGGKLYVDEAAYAALGGDLRMSRAAADQAGDDLYQGGAIDMRLVGDMVILELRQAEEAAA